MFDIAKEVEYQGKILPSTHPQNVLVRSISDNVMKAMKDKGDGLNWEVVVVDKPEDCNACCYPGGKIVVYTGILKHLTSDAEIAAVIGHEFGHGVARHGAESVTSLVWLGFLRFILKRFVMSFIANAMLKIFLKLPLSRRMEKEADYIGMMLMASAGYDPRVAPKVFEKLEKLMGDESSIGEFLSTHPSGKKRAQLLSQPKVMAKATRLYSANMREQRLSQSNNNDNTTSNSLAMIDLLQNLFLTVLVNHPSPW
ncbi:mitochondrial metalloendopeptidase OMA1 [Ziziphus jujuba]|uniref:Mitochondrial metalloendopeptidase OMA1 n=1 Tax=Ziziphus jujuba TaxID=326968 RepID=A0A6P3ZRM4_ZIZJJ|nr:mitochondrial metalloendopeptidase OMA1 [Ziziphus jujuba]